TSALEHYEHPEEFFRESFRVLKPGGKLFIHVPFAFPEHEVPFDFQRPTRYGLKRWFDAVGFEGVHVEPTSSSISTCLGFVKFALYEHHTGIRKALKQGVLPTLKLFPRYFVYHVFAKPVLFLLNLTLNRLPDENTIFPVGW